MEPVFGSLATQFKFFKFGLRIFTISGIAIATYEMNAIFILMLLGWFFVPVYLASGIIKFNKYLLFLPPFDQHYQPMILPTEGR